MKTRILTGLVLGIIFVALALNLPPIALGGLAAVVMLLGFHEWRGFCLKPKQADWAIMLVFMAAVAWVYACNTDGAIFLLILASFYWLIKWLFMSSAPLRASTCAFEGAWTLATAWLALMVLSGLPKGGYQLIFVVLLVASADSFAYFGGRLLGHTKLAPSISPGKTVEGVQVGVLGSFMVACLYNGLFLYPQGIDISFWMLVLLVLVASALSILGDLTESKMKRAAGVKDSGSLLPGHGGVLDRLDGHLAAWPVLALILALFVNAA